MATIIQNLNSIITTKNELNSILQENGVDGGEIFSEYPQKFRSVIASGGGSDKVTYSYLEERLSDYPTYSYVDENYVSYSYFYSYLNEWGESEGHNLVDRVVGLEEKTTQLDYRQGYTDSYLITYNQRISSLENAGYVSQNSLSSNSYASTSYVVEYVQSYASSYIDLTDYVSYSYLENKHYLQSIPNTYATYAAIANMSYVTQNDLSSRGFITATALEPYCTESYMMSYVSEKIPVSYDMSLYVTYTYMYSYVGNVVGDIETLLSNI